MNESTVEKLTIGALSAAATFMLVFTCRLLHSRHTQLSEDPYHRVRYKEKNPTENIIVHVGRCHCHRAQFRIRSTAEINAVDIPSKLRFPRVTVGYEDFEWEHPDQSTLSMYTVQQPDNASNVGIHIFCSNCGMQIVFAPSLDPVEVQVNLDCIDAGTIEKVNVAYHAAIETLPSHDTSSNGNMNRYESHQLQSLSHHHNTSGHYAHQRIPYQQKPNSHNHNSNNIRGKRLVESVLDGAPDSDTTEELFDHFHSPRVTPSASYRREHHRDSFQDHQQFRRRSNSGGEDDFQVGAKSPRADVMTVAAAADSDMNSVSSSLDFSESDHHHSHYHYGLNSAQSSQRSTPRRPKSLPAKTTSASISPFSGDKFAPESPLDLPMYQNLKLFMNHHMTADERKRESSSGSSSSIPVATNA